MKATCPSCNAHLNVDDKKIPAGGARIKCPTCQNIFPVKPGAATSGDGSSVPLPGGSTPAPAMEGSVPLPGGTTPAPVGMASVPLPGAGTPAPMKMSASVPLPGGSTPAPAMASAPSQDSDWDDVPTRIQQTVIPPEAVPGATTTHAPPSNAVDGFGRRAAKGVGGGAIGAVPLPGESGSDFAAPPDAFSMGTAQSPVPLPHSGTNGHSGAHPGNYAGASATGPTGTAQLGRMRPPVPLPAPEQSSASAFGQAMDFGDSTSLGFDPDTHVGPAHARDSVPLPGDTASPSPFGSHSPSFATEQVPLPGSQGILDDVPEASGADFAELPDASSPFGQSPSSGGFSFDAPSQSAGSNETSGFDSSDLPSVPGQAPQGKSAFDMSDLPSVPGQDSPQPSSSFDFSNLPSSPDAAPASGGFDFSAPSSPEPQADAAPSGFSFSEPAADPSPMGDAPPMAMGFDAAPEEPEPPPPDVNPAASFGEVDLGSSEGGFGFTSTDDPAPPAHQAAPPPEGLEMLSFLDEAAKQPGAVGDEGLSARRFHVKRRSGKVFGPFEQDVVVKMLEEGQLLGNEEVSLDGENWLPIGSEGFFEDTLNKLANTPIRAAAGPTQEMPATPAKQQPPSMERLKQLYEGRMAAVAVVEGKAPVPFTKRLPWIGAGILVVLIATGAIWSSRTRYGLFGLRALFPAKVSANTEEFKTLAEAKKDLQKDTFKGYKTTKELCERLLRTKPYPEVRAVWMQAVYILKRRYATATEADLQTALAEQENILLLGEKHVEVAKAQANLELTSNQPDKALVILSQAKARSGNDSDIELPLLNAEALTLKGQTTQAIAELKALVLKEKTSAKALHALGLLHLKAKEFDLANGRFAEALVQDPHHLSSAIELAAIELEQRKDNAKASEWLSKALEEKDREHLGPPELGRAFAIQAVLLNADRKTDAAVAAFELALKTDPNNVYAKGTYGALLVERHDYTRALNFLRDAVAKAPENLPYVENLLNALVGLGKMDEANKVMQQVQGRFPGNARIAFLAGTVEDGMDRTKQAEESYKKAIAADPSMVEASVSLAGLYLRLRRFSEAKPQLKDAVEKAPNHAYVRVVLGQLALAEGEIDKAHADLKKAVELNPNLPGAYMGLAQVYLAQGQPENAEKEAVKALNLDPKIHDGRLLYGTALWKLGRLDDAIAELLKAKDDDPRSLNISITLGAVYLDKQDLDGATANLLPITSQKDPGNPDANYYMGRVKRRRAEFTQAIELLRKAIDHAPRRKEFHYELGHIYMDARKAAEAVDEWKTALGIDPKYADALEALGKSALDRNRQREAIDYYERALEADPKRIRIHAAIGDSYAAMAQWGKAIESYQRVLAAQSDQKEVFSRLAYAYGEKKNWTEAIQWYKKAVQVVPDDQQSWYSLGYALKEKRQNSEAIAAFEEFLKHNTDAKMKKEVGDVIYDLKQEH